MFILIYFDTRIYAFTCIWKNMKIFKISCIIYMTNCEAMTSPTHSRPYHKDDQEMFSVKFQNVTTSLFPIFIIFAPICREIFTLSFKIMVILDGFPFNHT